MDITVLSTVTSCSLTEVHDVAERSTVLISRIHE